MRALVALLLVVALPALADETELQPKAPIEWAADSTKLCLERVGPVGLGGLCNAYADGAVSLRMMEVKGEPTGVEFLLDSQDPEELKAIAKACRIATMDGNLIDGFYGTLCVQQEVGRRNWEARRAARIAKQAPPPVAPGRTQNFAQIEIPAACRDVPQLIARMDDRAMTDADYRRMATAYCTEISRIVGEACIAITTEKWRSNNMSRPAIGFDLQAAQECRTRGLDPADPEIDACIRSRMMDLLRDATREMNEAVDRCDRARGAR